MAHHRRANNMKATSIDLGKVSGVGFVAERGNLPNFLPFGAPPLSEEQVLATIEAAMADQICTQPIIGLSTGGLLKHNGDPEPHWFSETRFRPMRVHETQNSGAASGAALSSYAGNKADDNLQVRLASAATIDEAKEVICSGLMRKLARTLMLSVDDVESSRTVNSYGVDSLVAVEIRTWVFKEVHSDVSVFEILSNVPLSELVDAITAKSKLVPESLRK
jgi:Phosphopantetheine attachment site